ncbi:hypothetical protein [Synechococcus sp. GFB01]|uniref:hypothetical protein n=1 Tax=Synechococcus sp. GFB01 TaxID=1662190 RepID=UPI00064E379F|nr:hypothetical protein [Synechococcus sp. GFB01]KMM17555.1 hypothetical protein SYNGFB01_03190 [Synechococcus sp. GFB01]
MGGSITVLLGTAVLANWPVAGGVPAAWGQQRLAGSCPLLVPPGQADSQPLRIDPSQVAAKNARGCLSEADAIYGPDGCPVRLCGRGSGVIELPAP